MHVKHDTTNEWKFDVGDGYANPPWVPDQVGGDWELKKRRRIQAIDERSQALREAGYIDGGVTFGLDPDDLIHLLGMYLFRTLPGIVPLDVNNIDETSTINLPDVAALESHVQTALGGYLNIINIATGLKKDIRGVPYLDQAALDAIVDPR